MSRAFLDAASGQPLSPAAITARDGFSDRVWADPNQPYHEGRVSAQILQAARETVATVLGVSASAISFVTSEQAGRVAIAEGVTACHADGTPRNVQFLTSPIERSDILDALASTREAKTSWLPVDRHGRVSAVIEVSDSRQPVPAAPAGRPVPANLVLGVVQAANLELGTVQPLAALERSLGVSGLICDATGALGLIDLPEVWTVLVADAAGWAGPRGAAIVARRNYTTPLPDSVDVLTAAQCAAALHELHSAREREAVRLAAMVGRIRSEVPALISDVDVLGDPSNRLPHVVTFSFLYADGERLASELDRRGVAVGSGSACASRSGLPSHVLSAIGALTHGNVRVSLPFSVTEADIDHFLQVLPEAVAVVRAEAGAP